MDDSRRKARLANAPGVMGQYARQYEEAKQAGTVPQLGKAKLERVFPDDIPAESSSARSPSLSPSSAQEGSHASVSGENTIVEIDPALIDEWELNDRPIDEFGDISDLTLRINQHGQIVPVLVRPKEDGRYELIYGRRRWTACKELGRKVKAFIRKLSDQDAYQAMVNENTGREDISSWARALSYKKALDMGVYPSQAALAAHLGLNKATLSNIMIYNRIPEEVASAVGSFAKVGIGTVKAILSLTEDKANIEHIIALAPQIQSGKMADKALTRTVEAARSATPTSTGTKSVVDAAGNKLFSIRRTERGVWSVTLAKDLTRDLSEKDLETKLKAAFGCE